MSWNKVKLSEVTTILGDGLHGTPTYDPNGEYYFINGSNLLNGKIVTSDKDKKVSYQEYLKHKKNLNDRTILVSINGTLGNVAIYNNEKIILGKSACYFNVKENIDKLFIKYVISSPFFKAYIHNLSTGTTIKNVSLKLMRDFEFYLPNLHIQKKISNILGTLDNKIDLNTQINQTLEQIAQALFKSWFVDFDPVRAKVQALSDGMSLEQAELAAMQAISGKTPEELTALSQTQPDRYAELAETAKAFPCEMVEVDGIEVPKGWNLKALDEIANYQNGLALQKFRPEDDEPFLPVVKIAQLRQGYADGEEKAKASIKPECIIDNGDVIFSWSGSLLVDIWCGGKAALNQHLFKVTSKRYPKWFYYFYTKYHLAEFQRIAYDKAVTMGHIKREHLSAAKCIMPNDELLANKTLGRVDISFKKMSIHN